MPKKGWQRAELLTLCTVLLCGWVLSTAMDQTQTATVSICASHCHIRLLLLCIEAVARWISCHNKEEIPTSLHHQRRADHLRQPPGCFPLTWSLYLLYTITVCSASKQTCLIEQDFKKSHLLSDTQNKSLKGRKTGYGNGVSLLHAEFWGRFSMFCATAVFKPAEGLVQFL